MNLAHAESTVTIHDDNLFAPPKYDPLEPDLMLEHPNAAWRAGPLLVARKGAELPDRCLKCNAPADGYQFKRSLTWASPYWFVSLLVIGPILFFVIYSIVSWRGQITVGLCPIHRRKWARSIALGWILAVTGIATVFAAAVSADNFRAIGIPANTAMMIGICAGIVLFIVGLAGGMIGSRVLEPTRIDKNFIWLKGVSPQYLAEFPDWSF